MNRPIFLALVILLSVCSAFAFLPPEAVSFSPKTWLHRDLQRLEALSLQNSQRRPKPLAFSDGKGLVAGTSSAMAVHAGTEALKKGGNAMDACLTTALTEIVLAAGSHLSYAGAANILYYDSSTGDTHNFDAGWNKPYYIDPAQIPEHHSELGNGATVLVPGFIAGVSTASEKYSLMPLSKLLEPALYFATKGFKLPSDLAEEIRKNYNQRSLLRTKEGKHIFTNPKTKKPYKAGERFRQPKLAKFIKRLSKYGKDYFYRGPWAEDMVETIQSHEGYVTMEDMTEYQVRSPEPASTLYQKYHVLTSGAEWGGAELVEKLNLMELAGVGGSTDSYLTNATKLFWLASITRLSSFISFFTHAVPNGKQLLQEHLGVDVDNSYRKTKEAAEELWDKIASPEKMADVNDIMREILASAEMDIEQHPRGSSGVVAVDSAGNVCSLVHGTDSGIWGTGLFVQGVSLPSSGIALKSLIKETKSGTRVPSGLQPVIIFKEEFREFDGFGRRLRRDISVAKKNKKRLAAKKKGLSNRGYTGVEVPQKLVVLRTQNRVRSQLMDESLAKSSQPGKSQERQRFEHVAEIREQTEVIEEDKTPGEKSIPSTEELEEFEELHPTDPYPLKISRNHHTVGKHADVTANPTDKEETQGNEEEENEFEEEITATKGPTEREEIREEKAIYEGESKEFPHLGIPDAWKSGTILEETDEPIFHTGLVPVLALACTGPSHPLAVPQYITNILDSGMSPKAALESPTFLAPSPHSFQQDIQVEKYSIDDNVLLDVNESGQLLTEVDSQTADEVAGIGAAVTLNSDRKMLGCAHPSKGGLAEGVSVVEG
ncbi:hypothetical protein ACROYT_G021503 [Oculina patagonica]